MEQEELKLSDKLAIERTTMAADRTLLAWVRTSISFIAFGFTIYKVLENLYKPGVSTLMRPETPRNIGLIMIAAGTVPLLLIIIQYSRTLKRLGVKTSIFLNPNFMTAFVVFILGSLLLISFIFKFAIL
jgi:putative membrane protein